MALQASSTWAAFTTAASNGSVNSMHDSYTPLGGMVTMLLMQLGEVVFGGVGCGLYGMLAFAILTVFIAGLMVGRTPEFLGKKIEPYEMKWSVLVCLATPIAILVGSGLAAVVPSVMDSLNNGGAHGFSEMLYAYSSCWRQQWLCLCRFQCEYRISECKSGTGDALCPVPAHHRHTCNRRQLGWEKENCHDSGHHVYHKWNVCFSADRCGIADWCAELLPGACSWSTC